MECKIIQVNINHASQAQDLLVQHMREWKVDTAVVAEPYRVPKHPEWFGDRTGKAAIYAICSVRNQITFVERGESYIAV